MKKLNKNFDYWQSILLRYRIAKKIRNYMHIHRLSYSAIARKTGFSRQYIYAIEQILIKPSDDFINKLKDLGIVNGKA